MGYSLSNRYFKKNMFFLFLWSIILVSANLVKKSVDANG